MEHWVNEKALPFYRHFFAPIVDATVSFDARRVLQTTRELPQLYASWLGELYTESPWHVIVEAALIFAIIFIILAGHRSQRRAGGGNSRRLPKRQQQELIDEWRPEPLVDTALAKNSRAPLVVSGRVSTHISFEGDKDAKLNFSTFDMLSLSSREELRLAATQALDKYGLGSCGPRGFYGTIDVHMHLEQLIAKMMGVQEAIVYSDGNSTASSAIPAFAKRGDLLVVDDGVSDSIRTGLMLSRATLLFFTHNDMTDLERVLTSVRDTDRRLRRRSDCQRRFIVCEGLYRNHGDVCPLPQVAKLKDEHNFRLIVDESMSFGVLGEGGRGVTEFHGVSEPTDVVDILTGSLENAVGTTGGFCVGSLEVVDHQRLSGAAYCFSASAPPFMSSVAMKAIHLLQSEVELRRMLRQNAAEMHGLLSAVPGLKLTSERGSPILHLRLAKDVENDRAAVDALLQAIVDDARTRGAVFTACRYTTQDRRLFEPSIRVVVQSAHTKLHIKTAAKALKDAAAKVLH